MGIMLEKNPIASTSRIVTTWRKVTSYNPFAWPAWPFITTTDKLKVGTRCRPSVKIIFLGSTLVPRISNPWLHALGFPSLLLLDLFRDPWLQLLDFKSSLSFLLALETPKVLSSSSFRHPRDPLPRDWDSETQEERGEVLSCNRIRQVDHCYRRTLSTFIAGDVTSVTCSNSLPYGYTAISLLCEFSFILQIFVMQPLVCHPHSLLPSSLLLLQPATQALRRTRRRQICTRGLSSPWWDFDFLCSSGLGSDPDNGGRGIHHLPSRNTKFKGNKWEEEPPPCM